MKTSSLATLCLIAAPYSALATHLKRQLGLLVVGGGLSVLLQHTKAAGWADRLPY